MLYITYITPAVLGSNPVSPRKGAKPRPHTRYDTQQREPLAGSAHNLGSQPRTRYCIGATMARIAILALLLLAAAFAHAQDPATRSSPPVRYLSSSEEGVALKVSE